MLKARRPQTTCQGNITFDHDDTADEAGATLTFIYASKHLFQRKPSERTESFQTFRQLDKQLLSGALSRQDITTFWSYSWIGLQKSSKH
jgi:hypothetical protein